jgi:2-dehydropantoate 2-reductase
VTVVGAGAIGAVGGTGLIKAGCDVQFVDLAADHVQAINRQGLAVEDAEGVEVFRAPALLPTDLKGPLEQVVLAVKTQHTEAAMDMLMPHLDDHSVVLSLQNGLNPDVIAARIGSQRTQAAFVNFQSIYVEPGRVRAGRKGSLYVGELDGRITPRIQRLGELLQRARPTTVTDNIYGYLWAKMSYAGLLIASALVDAPVYESIERYPALMQEVCGEVARAARARGIRVERFDFVDPTAMMEGRYDFTEMLADWRARQIPYTGIWRDIVVRKRPTEVGHQMGQIIERAASSGVAMPLNRRMIEMMREIERGDRPLSWENLEELSRAS